MSGATLGASDWALRKLGVGYDDTENRMGEVAFASGTTLGKMSPLASKYGGKINPAALGLILKDD